MVVVEAVFRGRGEERGGEGLGGKGRGGGRPRSSSGFWRLGEIGLGTNYHVHMDRLGLWQGVARGEGVGGGAGVDWLTCFFESDGS